MFRFAIRVPAHKNDDDDAAFSAIPRPGPSAAQPLPPLLHIDWSLLPPMPAGVEGQSGGFVDSTTLVRRPGPPPDATNGLMDAWLHVFVGRYTRLDCRTSPIPAASTPPTS